VIVRDFDLFGISILPLKAYAILLVDANTVLADSIPAQSLKTIARRDREISEIANTVELIKLTPSDRPQRFRTPRARRSRIGPVKDIFGPAIGERAYHRS